MGFLDTKAKAAQLDKMQQAEYANDKAAAQMAAQLAMENEVLKKGLAYNANPMGYANVPGQEIPGYQIPSQGEIGPSSYRRPVQQAPVEQGLAAKTMQYLGGK